jgi:hypothetical protein
LGVDFLQPGQHIANCGFLRQTQFNAFLNGCTLQGSIQPYFYFHPATRLSIIVLKIVLRIWRGILAMLGNVFCDRLKAEDKANEKE